MVIVSVALLGGCVAPRGAASAVAPQAGVDPQATVEPPLSEEAAEPPEAVALRLNARECERFARTLRTPDERFRVIRSCVDREEFTDSSILMRPPWSRDLSARGMPGLLVLARVLARRGFDFRVDVALAQDNGFGVHDLDLRWRQLGEYVGKVVMIRGVLHQDRGWVTREQVAEAPRSRKAYISGRYLYLEQRHESWDRPRARFVWGLSGVEFGLRRLPDSCRELLDRPSIQILRVTAAEPPRGDDVVLGVQATVSPRGEGELLACVAVAPESER